MTTSPMMKQYEDAKAVCGDALLLFRMGDFYELFYEDAKTVAAALSLTLTSREKGEHAIPMAGFPHHQLDGYLGKLIQKGFRVAVCEQVEDARFAKGLVRREVTRVVTPGTITDDSLLDPSRNNYLAAVMFLPGLRRASQHRVGLAWVDLSTGEFYATSIAPATLPDHLERIQPAEILISEEDRVLQEELQEYCVTTRPPWVFSQDSAQRCLLEHFHVVSLAGFGFADEDVAGTCAAGAIVEYLKETQKSALGHVQRIYPYSEQAALAMDQATRRSLELTRTLNDQQRHGSLLGVLDQAVTAMGSRMIAQWLANPLTHVEQIERRLDAVQELVASQSLTVDLREQLRGIYDLQRLLARVATLRASPRDVKFVGRTLQQLPKIKAALTARKSELLQQLELSISLCPELYAELDAALVDDCPLTTRDGGIIRSGYHAELDALRELAAGGKQWLNDYQAQEQQRTCIPNLKLGFNKVFGFYIEITNSHRDKLPENYIRKQTLKNAERYITPELKAYEDRVLSSDEKAKDLEYELFLGIRQRVADQLDALWRTAEILATLDALSALADTAVRRNYCRPEMLTTADVEIRDGRHPVLDSIYTPGTFVANDTVLSEIKNRLLIITGPNMAGKSTYIRQVALITIMAHMGSFVPARKAKIGLTDRVFARVGASDELSKGQSTFMVEMTESARILNTASEQSLVILDEVGRGTSTYDGLSLAWAIVEYLHDRVRCRTLFATHYHELTDLADTNDAISNLNVAVKERNDDVVFLHRIVPGAADKSYGIHVAKLAGIPRSVNDRATEILDWLEKSHHRHNDHRNRDDKQLERFQLTLFEMNDHPILDNIREFNVDEQSPIDALIQIREWQQQLARESQPKQPR